MVYVRAAAEHNIGQLLAPPDGYTLEDHIRDVARTVLFLASDDCATRSPRIFCSCDH